MTLWRARRRAARRGGAESLRMRSFKGISEGQAFGARGGLGASPPSAASIARQHFADGDAERPLLADELGERADVTLLDHAEPSLLHVVAGDGVVQYHQRAGAAEGARQLDVLPDALVRVVAVDEGHVEQRAADLGFEKAARLRGVAVAEVLFEVL